MAFLVEDEQVWKCHKHPSKRRTTGICPKCLRDRLVTLCPDCARPRPCACSPPPIDSSSASSSSASFSLFSFSRGGSRHDTGTATNSEVDPALRKSRSVATSFLRSRSRYVGSANGGCVVEVAVKNSKDLPPKVGRKKINLWSVFNKSKKCDVYDDGVEEELDKSDDVAVVDNNSMMMRSRSVAVGAGNRLTPARQKGWYFPSPINAFRHSKCPRSVPVT